MKILKYVLYGIIIIAALFLSMGIIQPTITYGHEISVDKPVEEAWGVGLDESKYHQWLEGYRSSELIEGEYAQAGSKYKVIVVPGPGQPEFEMIQTMVSLKEYNQVDLHFDSDFMEMDQTYQYTQKDGKTHVGSLAKVRAKGLITRSMFALMETLGGSFTKQERKNMEAFKTAIQENTTNYYPNNADLSPASVESSAVGSAQENQ